ncbi:Lactose operon repressor [Raoultella planticola]|uniref:Lactose operon repressor n=1 Tax=Raoultella planticola TaxID=575 RepID=A0A485A799_RAOPL|nr:Lactose operon repressor [Raoultella planticola]
MPFSVTGYDDTADSLYFQPPLTTVAQNFDLLGKRAVELLTQQMAAPPGADPRTAPHPI